MANGDLGGGIGTLESPFEIWDVYDLNALRGKPTSSAAPIYVNFKADIDFAGSPFEAHFPTVRFGNDTATANSFDFVNIEGENHSIRNFKQTGNSNDVCGLFGPLNGEIKNLSIINCDVNYTGNSVSCGILCRTLKSKKIENIRITGTITHQGYAGGIAYNIAAVDAVTPCVIQDCVINVKAVGKGSNGFNGYCFSTSGSMTYQFFRCVSACNFYSESAGANLGGFVGNSAGTMVIDSCISQCKFTILTAAQQFTGTVAGYRATTNSITMSFKNCISKCRFEGKPPSTANNLAPFAPTYTSNAVQCYSICEYDLKDSAAKIRGGGEGAILFDWEVSGLPLERFSDSANAVTTAQLQDRAFLEGKGWTF
jgi:hypothetical protein